MPPSPNRPLVIQTPTSLPAPATVVKLPTALLSPPVQGRLPIPTVTVLERQTAGGLWQPDNVIIDAGEDVNLRWISANATICTGDGFDTASTTSGSKAIVEPGAGTSTAYIVSCTSSEGTVSDSLTITARGLPFVTANPPVIRPASQGGGVSTILLGHQRLSRLRLVWFWLAE